MSTPMEKLKMDIREFSEWFYDNDDNCEGTALRKILASLYQQLKASNERIEELEEKLNEKEHQNEKHT
jgi:predicted RNase H-like nuclease (RuvC/YqgF family)